MQVTLCLTHDCTLRCPYCYAGEKRRKAMPWEVAKAAIDRTVAWQLAHYPEKDYVLGFFGGEPLLEWGLLRRADAYAEEAARAAGLRFGRTVTTNLTLLDREKADWLRARRYKLGLSIDGSAAMHDANRRFPDGRGSHALCLAALPLVEDFPAPRPEIICVVTPATAPLLAEGVRFLHARSALPIAVNPDFTADWDDASRAALRAAQRAQAMPEQGGAVLEVRVQARQPLPRLLRAHLQRERRLARLGVAGEERERAAPAERQDGLAQLRVPRRQLRRAHDGRMLGARGRRREDATPLHAA